MKYKTREEITAAFIADGWSTSISFRDATPEEIAGNTYIKQAATQGRKFYAMTANGNMYDDAGTLVYYNIPCRT